MSWRSELVTGSTGIMAFCRGATCTLIILIRCLVLLH